MLPLQISAIGRKVFKPIQYIDSSKLHKSVHYKEYEPSPSVSRYVCCYWSLATEKSLHDQPHRILPDGCIDIIFDLQNQISFLTGVMRQTQRLYLSGGINIFGIRFLPLAIFFLIQDDVSKFPSGGLEARYAVSSLRDMVEKVIEKQNIHDIIPLLNKELQLFFKDFDPNHSFSNILNFCIHKKGNTSVKEISDYFSRSSKQITRYFKENVGMSTKAFLNIVRFQNLMILLRHYPRAYPQSLSLGYYDQSHVIKDLRKYLGNDLYT